MLTSIQKKYELIRLAEPKTILRRLYVKLNSDWEGEGGFIKRLIVNHDFRFIYCPIYKNASTSMMAALLELSKTKAIGEGQFSSDVSVRSYINLNYSLANYTKLQAKEILDSDYFKFTIVRNPWARLVSTYSNYFIRLPAEKKVISKIAQNASKHIYGEHLSAEKSDSITFEQYVDYVVSKSDSQLDPHSGSQSQYLAGIQYDYVAKLETLKADIEYIKEKLNLPITMEKFNKTSYKKYIKSDPLSEDYSTLTPKQLRNLESKIPAYQQFYTSELVEAVRNRYNDDVTLFSYSFE